MNSDHQSLSSPPPTTPTIQQTSGGVGSTSLLYVSPTDACSNVMHQTCSISIVDKNVDVNVNLDLNNNVSDESESIITNQNGGGGRGGNKPPGGAGDGGGNSGSKGKRYIEV